MKKASTVFCVVLCVLLLLPYSALAAQEGSVYRTLTIPSVGEDITRLSPEENAAEGRLSGFSFNSGAYNHYAIRYRDMIDNQLDREVYDALTKLTIASPSVTCEFSHWITMDEFNSLNFLQIFDAFVMDYPEIFWFSHEQLDPNISCQQRSDGTLNYLVFKFNIDTTKYPSAATLETQMWDFVKNLPFTYNNRYGFVKGLHDYLCDNNVYDLTAVRAHDAIGAILDGKTVCQGYGEAFKIVCDYYKIPCICIVGTANGGNHMWNAVQMDDGNWYLIDITWDDQNDPGTAGGRIFYDYFLSGLQTRDTYFGGNLFSVSHVAWTDSRGGDASQGAPLQITFPPIQSAAFSGTASTLTAFGATKNADALTRNRMLVSSLYIGTDAIYYNGLALSIDPAAYRTGGAFQVPSGTDFANQSWTFALYGDVDGDGVCTDSDVDYVSMVALSGAHSTVIEYRLSDVNTDGAVDVLDVANYELASNGNSTLEGIDF